MNITIEMRATSIRATGAIESFKEGNLLISNVVEGLTCNYELYTLELFAKLINIRVLFWVFLIKKV